MNKNLDSIEANLLMARYNLERAESVISDPGAAEEEKFRALQEIDEHRRHVAHYEREKLEFQRRMSPASC